MGKSVSCLSPYLWWALAALDIPQLGDTSFRNLPPSLHHFLCVCMSSLLIRMPSLNIDSVVIQDDSIPRSLKNLLRQCFQEKLYLDVPSIQYFYSLQTLVITFPLKDNHFELYPLMNLNPKIIQSYIFIHLKYMWKLALSSA